MGYNAVKEERFFDQNRRRNKEVDCHLTVPPSRTPLLLSVSAA